MFCSQQVNPKLELYPCSHVIATDYIEHFFFFRVTEITIFLLNLFLSPKCLQKKETYGKKKICA